MVARKFDTETAGGVLAELFVEVFEWWRALVTAWRNALVRLYARLFPAEKPFAAGDHWLLHPAVRWLGLGCLALGVAVGIAQSPSGSLRFIAAWAGAQSVLWAFVRWLLMRSTARGAARDRSVLLGASSLGLVAYVIAATPELRIAAWALSGLLTWLGLVSLGDRKGQAARTVGIAWGAQALVVAGSWIARTGVLAYLAMRG